MIGTLAVAKRLSVGSSRDIMHLCVLGSFIVGQLFYLSMLGTLAITSVPLFMSFWGENGSTRTCMI